MVRGTLLMTALLLQASQTDPARAALNEAYWDAARAGDVATVRELLDKGVDVNARARYDMTAVAFAADKGHVAVIELLVSRGADVNVQDTFYQFRPLDMALMNGHADAALVLLRSGSQGADRALQIGVQSNNAALVKAALGGDVTSAALKTALQAAQRAKRAEIAPMLEAAMAARSVEPIAPAVTLDTAVLERHVGRYRDAAGNMDVTVTLNGGRLFAQAAGQPSIGLEATSATTFRSVANPEVMLTFAGRGGETESVALGAPPNVVTLSRVAGGAVPPGGSAPTSVPTPEAARRESAAAATAAAADPKTWPSFRGHGAAGISDGQRLATEWDAASGKNIKWKVAIPGFGNSSPVAWGDRVFVTTAVSKGADKTFRTGLYGDVAPVNDLSEHEWKAYCLDRMTGRILWERTAHSGVPGTKRHTKATQANSTPATDGKRLVAVFGSIGLLVAWDLDGRELWRVDTGVLDSGWFLDPTYQWGHSSSPVIYRNTVIVQADRQKASFIAAYDLDTGRQLWRTERPDEISTWGTPALVRTADGRDELVTNGTKVRGYDPASGALRWTLGPNSEITIATPVAGHGLVFVTGGYPPVRPIYAIRPGASGDITLTSGASSNGSIAWSNSTEGTYIPTPLVYGRHLITLNVNGIVSGYDARTGQREFRGRVGMGGAFSASPIVADGRLYVASEDGDVFVVAATAELTQIAVNAMNEPIMATPAVAGGLLIFRTLNHVYGIAAD